MLRQAVETGLLRFSALAIVENDVLLQSVFELAFATGLSAYDASYLWLARREDVTLVTLDAQLANVALR